MSDESKIRKEHIFHYISEKGTATFAEICAYMKEISISRMSSVNNEYSKSVIAGHLQHLINKGIIERNARATYKLKEHAKQDESEGWGKPISQNSENTPGSAETPKEDTPAPEPTPEPSVSEQARQDAYN